MNRERRIRLKHAADMTGEAYRIVESILADERCALENTPEGLQETGRYEDAEAFADSVEDALADLEIARDAMRDLIG